MDENIERLLSPFSLGNVTLANRVVMAPMTRQRSRIDGMPVDVNRLYYQQRASAGLIITEGLYPSLMGKGYVFAPGLVSEDHATGWREVTDAVHADGGVIFAQIMHAGRISDPLMLPQGNVPVAPSSVQPDVHARHYTVNSPRAARPYGQPRALSTSEVYDVIAEFARCAMLAQAAGFDGVEIHAASGYLPMQFLSPNTNVRTDEFGGSIANRARFLLNIVDAMQKATNAGFVAVKLSPGWTYHDVFDDDAEETYAHVTRELSSRGLAYLHVGNFGQPWDVHGLLRPLFDGPYLVTSGYTRSSAGALIAAGGADMVAFGQSFIANPDLVNRFRHGWGLNRPDRATYYTQGAEGYVDYPLYGEEGDASLIDIDSQPLPIGRSR